MPPVGARSVGDGELPYRTPEHGAFLRVLDLVHEGLGFFDLSGVLIHANRAFDRALQDTRVWEGLHTEILEFAEHLASVISKVQEVPGSAEWSRELESRTIYTPSGTFQLRGSYLSPDLFGSGGSVLITLDVPGLPLLSNEALKKRFGLSPQESRIARLIADGRSNSDVAAEIGISPHTVRRHTERLFAKLRIRSRTEVGQRLYNEGRNGGEHR